MMSPAVTGAMVLAFRDFLSKALSAPAMETLVHRLPPSTKEQVLDASLSYGDLVPESSFMLCWQLAASVRGLPLAEDAFEFGQALLPWLVQRAGYDQCMHRIAPTLMGFARCLSQVLHHMQLALTGVSTAPQLPLAQVTDVGPKSFCLRLVLNTAPDELHSTAYLAVFQGMLSWAAVQLYNVQLTFTNVDNIPSKEPACCVGAVSPVPRTFVALGGSPVPNQPLQLAAGSSVGLEPDACLRLLPFHFALDADLRVLQAGSALTALLPQLSRPGIPVDSVLKVQVPQVQWSMESLQVVLGSDTAPPIRIQLVSPCSPDLVLQGVLHRGPPSPTGASTLIFLGAPCISSMQQLQRLGLYLCDFGPQDLTADQAFVCASRQAQAAQTLEDAAEGNTLLRERLTQALALQQEQARHVEPGFDCPGHVLLHLLDCLMLGEAISTEQILAARSALLRSGNDLWQPTDVDFSKAMVDDKEVTESLAKLLGTAAASSVDRGAARRDNHSRALPRVDLEEELGEASAAKGSRRLPPQVPLTSSSVAVADGLHVLFSPRLSRSQPTTEGGAPSNAQCTHGVFAPASPPNLGQASMPGEPLKRWIKAVSKVLKPFKSSKHKKDKSADALSPKTAPGSVISAHGAETDAAQPRGRIGFAIDVDSTHRSLGGRVPEPLMCTEPWNAIDTSDSWCTARHSVAAVPQAANARPSTQKQQWAAVQHHRANGGAPQAACLALLQSPSDETSEALRHLDEWQFDALAMDQATQGRPLSYLAFFLIKRMGVMDRLRLDAPKLASFLVRVEDGYGDSPYHNRIHACDCLRTLHVILTRGGVLELMAQRSESSSVQTLQEEGEDPDEECLQLFTCYLAAIVHDFEHRGVNNDFLIKSSDPLALRYNDHSPMENHHLAAAFSLMQEGQYAFLPATSAQVKSLVRKNVVELVLATDMKQHFALTSSFSHKVARPSSRDASVQNTHELHSHSRLGESHRRPSTRLRVGSGWQVSLASNSHAHSSSGQFAWDRDTELLVLKMALKAADLGHLTSHIDVHKQWVARLEEELFLQGDRERALGQPISPLMDRTKAGIQKSQCGFFKVVAMPMYKGFTQVFSQCSLLLVALESNYEYWRGVEAAHLAAVTTACESGDP